MAKRQHKHLIDVQTDEPLVTVTIGSDGGVPGGFAKLFNRVVDSEAWARLSDAARAVYIPLVRFADHRNQFRVRMGQASIMRYSGLSRSSAKRAIKDLITQKLIVVIERGGVSELGENESNVYQLLVPAERPNRAMGVAAAQPQGVQVRTPTHVAVEPPPRSPRDLLPGVQRTGGRVDWTEDGGANGGPQYRTPSKEFSNRSTSTVTSFPPKASDSAPSDAAVLLEESGVEPLAARQLATQYPRQRIVDVIATMEWRRARGKCDNPGGFIHDALMRQWQTPQAVLDARAKAEARLRAEAVERQAKQSVVREQANVAQEEARVQAIVDALDDDELQILAGSVLEKYRGNTAVTAVLTRKPPRECRLMKMEIAALLSAAGALGQRA